MTKTPSFDAWYDSLANHVASKQPAKPAVASMATEEKLGVVKELKAHHYATMDDTELSVVVMELIRTIAIEKKNLHILSAAIFRAFNWRDSTQGSTWWDALYKYIDSKANLEDKNK